VKIATAPEFRKLFILGLVAQLVAAWFSVGYHHPDEHFQVLEFCNYKLGLSPSCDLAWEYAARCRSALLPSIAFILSRGLEKAGMFNPFTIAFLLRLITGSFTWVVICRMLKVLLPEMITQRGKHALVWCSFFLWFVPYTGVRFSPENIAGLSIFLAVSFLYRLHDKDISKQAGLLLLSGFLIGLALFIRLQIAFAVLGLGCWLLLYGKWTLRQWSIMVGGGIVSVGLLVCLDRMFYGTWFFSPYNYFDVNILKHVAAKFGVEPWWYYFTEFLNIGVPPISVALLPLFLIGVKQKPRHLLTWITIAFIAGHSLIGHKEMRFLFPVSISFIFFACVGFEWVIQRWPDNKALRRAIPIIAGMNIVMLVFKLFTPGHEAINYYKTVYSYSHQQKTILVTSGNTIYNLAGLCNNFYQPKGLEERYLCTSAGLAETIKNAHGAQVLYLSSHVSGDTILRDFKTEKVYCLLPSWTRYLNFYDWQSRCPLWSIYRVYPATK
jgi:phosphatidylinositol glycan class B